MKIQKLKWTKKRNHTYEEDVEEEGGEGEDDD